MGHLCTCWVRASWAILGGAASLFSFFLPLALSLISLSENCACGSCSHSSFPLLVLSLFCLASFFLLLLPLVFSLLVPCCLTFALASTSCSSSCFLLLLFFLVFFLLLFFFLVALPPALLFSFLRFLLLFFLWFLSSFCYSSSDLSLCFCLLLVLLFPSTLLLLVSLALGFGLFASNLFPPLLSSSFSSVFFFLAPSCLVLLCFHTLCPCLCPLLLLFLLASLSFPVLFSSGSCLVFLPLALLSLSFPCFFSCFLALLAALASLCRTTALVPLIPLYSCLFLVVKSFSNALPFAVGRGRRIRSYFETALCCNLKDRCSPSNEDPRVRREI